MNDSRLEDLEHKVAKLEADIRELRNLVADGSSEPWWKRTAGMFKDDPVWAEIVRLGQKIRRRELTMSFIKVAQGKMRRGASHERKRP